MTNDSYDINDGELRDLYYLPGTDHAVQVDLNFDEYEGKKTSFFATAQDNDNVTAYLAYLRDATVSHALTAALSIDSRYDAEFFYSVMIDTGCAGASWKGLSQYRPYYLLVIQPEKICKTIKGLLQIRHQWYGLRRQRSNQIFT